MVMNAQRLFLHLIDGCIDSIKLIEHSEFLSRVTLFALPFAVQSMSLLADQEFPEGPPPVLFHQIKSIVNRDTCPGCSSTSVLIPPPPTACRAFLGTKHLPRDTGRHPYNYQKMRFSATSLCGAE